MHIFLYYVHHTVKATVHIRETTKKSTGSVDLPENTVQPKSADAVACIHLVLVDALLILLFLLTGMLMPEILRHPLPLAGRLRSARLPPRHRHVGLRLRLYERLYHLRALLLHVPRHLVDDRTALVVHYRVREHQQNVTLEFSRRPRIFFITLKFQRIIILLDDSAFDVPPNSQQIHRTVNQAVVTGCLIFRDRFEENGGEFMGSYPSVEQHY